MPRANCGCRLAGRRSLVRSSCHDSDCAAPRAPDETIGAAAGAAPRAANAHSWRHSPAPRQTAPASTREARGRSAPREELPRCHLGATHDRRATLCLTRVVLSSGWVSVAARSAPIQDCHRRDVVHAWQSEK
eukprot:2514942-Prymnesium_polylepis.2